jgi:hypothetical protein
MMDRNLKKIFLGRVAARYVLDILIEEARKYNLREVVISVPHATQEIIEKVSYRDMDIIWLHNLYTENGLKGVFDNLCRIKPLDERLIINFGAFIPYRTLNHIVNRDVDILVATESVVWNIKPPFGILHIGKKLIFCDLVVIKLALLREILRTRVNISYSQLSDVINGLMDKLEIIVIEPDKWIPLYIDKALELLSKSLTRE